MLRATLLVLLALTACRGSLEAKDPGTLSDADGDTYDADVDCDDADPSIHPDAEEACDGVDQDCDEEIDEDAVDAPTFYADADGDGFYDPDDAITSCEAPAGYISPVESGEDCDDRDVQVHPEAAERCNDVDDDCDGSIDEDVQDTWYADADGDGHGDGDAPIDSCDPPAGYVANTTDCDDTSAQVSPNGTERCNGIDDDCDGETDEDDAVDALTFYADADADGYGDADATTESCEAPEGYVDDATDCDDADAAISPAATETCNAVDDDCDALVDDEDPDVDGGSTWYIDYDGDGYGTDGSYTTEACEAPSGFVEDDSDCDDRDGDVHPAATETCNGVDDDCDGTVDEDDASDASTWYVDADEDGYGDASSSTVACDTPSGYVADDTDCDDADETAYPDATEIYDGVDNDCDAEVDEDLWVGTGADGSLSVTSDVDLSTTDAPSWTVTAISGSTVTVDGTPTGLAAGDEVLLINLQGTDSAHDSVGAWEFGWVDSVSGSDVTLVDAVDGTYGEVSNSDLSDQVIVLQRVPQYTDVSVYSGATLSTAAWDGTSGGVVAFRATGTVWVESGGAISVSGLGFAGGDTGTCNNCDAFQGESYAGTGDGDSNGSTYNESIGAYAANEGGGGANVTGGGGEHAGNATDGDSWNGGGYTAPSAGDTYGTDALTTIFFGSGGGGVWNGGTDTPGEDPGPGGNGGGILYIGADAIETEDADALTADGDDTTHWASGSWTYGAGGGAGGSIFLVADSVSLAADSVSASGGLGQSAYTRDGGDGGDGRVRVDFATADGSAWGSTTADTALDDACEPDPAWSELAD